MYKSYNKELSLYNYTLTTSCPPHDQYSVALTSTVRDMAKCAAPSNITWRWPKQDIKHVTMGKKRSKILAWGGRPNNKAPKINPIICFILHILSEWIHGQKLQQSVQGILRKCSATSIIFAAYVSCYDHLLSGWLQTWHLKRCWQENKPN